MEYQHSYDLTTTEGQRGYIKKRFSEHLDERLPIEQQNLTQIFREGGVKKKKLNGVCKNFKRDIEKFGGKENSFYSDIPIHRLIALFAYTASDMPNELRDQVNGFVKFVDGNHPIQSTHPLLPFSCSYNAKAHAKNRNQTLAECDKVSNSQRPSSQLLKQHGMEVGDKKNDPIEAKPAKKTDSNNMKQEIRVVPGTAYVSASEGTSLHTIINESGARFAFKMKVSSAQHYRISPSCGFIEGLDKVSMTITRLLGPPQVDICHVLHTEVTAEITDPQIPFKEDFEKNTVQLMIKAMNDGEIQPLQLLSSLNKKENGKSGKQGQDDKTEEDVKQISFTPSDVVMDLTQAVPTSEIGGSKSEPLKHPDLLHKMVDTTPTQAVSQKPTPSSETILKSISVFSSSMGIRSDGILEKKEDPCEYCSNELFEAVVALMKSAFRCTIHTATIQSMNTKKTVRDLDIAQLRLFQDLECSPLTVPSAKHRKFVNSNALNHMLDTVASYFF